MHHNWFFPSRAADPWTNVFDPRGCIEVHTELSVKTPKQRSFTANGLPLQWTTHHQHIDALWCRIPCQYIQCTFPLKPFDVIPIPFDASLHAFIWWSLCFPWKPPQEKCRKPWTFFSVEKLHKNPKQPPFGCTNLNWFLSLDIIHISVSMWVLVYRWNRWTPHTPLLWCQILGLRGCSGATLGCGHWWLSSCSWGRVEDGTWKMVRLLWRFVMFSSYLFPFTLKHSSIYQLLLSMWQRRFPERSP